MIDFPEIRFVSLGGDCQPAFHIGERRGKAVTSVFDWLGTPPLAAEKLISNSFSDFFSPAALDWRWVKDLWVVLDTINDVESAHGFRDQEPETIRREVGKMNWLARLFMDEIRAGEPTCYVRRLRRGQDGATHEADTRRLYETVRRLNPNSVFLYLQDIEERPPTDNEGFITAYNPHFVVDWRGDAALYRENFSFAEKVFRDRAAIRRLIEGGEERERVQEWQNVTALAARHMSGDAPLSDDELRCLDQRMIALICVEG